MLKQKETNVSQDAVNLLFFPENPESALYKDVNTYSASVFESALKGDFEPFASVLKNRERRAGPVRQLIEMQLKENQKRTGEIQEVRTMGTFPSNFGEGKAVVTFVELRSEKGSLFFRLF